MPVEVVGGWKKVKKKERKPATLWYSGSEIKNATNRQMDR
jgi:hypothetical protein